jgi:hypothetical protein
MRHGNAKLTDLSLTLGQHLSPMQGSLLPVVAVNDPPSARI